MRPLHQLEVAAIRCPSEYLYLAFNWNLTLPLQALQRALTSKLGSLLPSHRFDHPPGRRYRVPHRAAHSLKPREICGIGNVFQIENVTFHDVVGKAGNGIVRVGLVRSVHG